MKVNKLSNLPENLFPASLFDSSSEFIEKITSEKLRGQKYITKLIGTISPTSFKTLKDKLGVGGSVKKGVYLLQGNFSSLEKPKEKKRLLALLKDLNISFNPEKT